MARCYALFSQPLRDTTSIQLETTCWLSSQRNLKLRRTFKLIIITTESLHRKLTTTHSDIELFVLLHINRFFLDASCTYLWIFYKTCTARARQIFSFEILQNCFLKTYFVKGMLNWMNCTIKYHRLCNQALIQICFCWQWIIKKLLLHSIVSQLSINK